MLCILINSNHQSKRWTTTSTKNKKKVEQIDLLHAACCMLHVELSTCRGNIYEYVYEYVYEYSKAIVEKK